MWRCSPSRPSANRCARAAASPRPSRWLRRRAAWNGWWRSPDGLYTPAPRGIRLEGIQPTEGCGRMVQRSGYSLGELCWADIQTPDVAAAKAFYAAVFGWRYEDLPTPDGRSYAKAFLDDDLVATVAPQPLQGGAPRPAQWNVYFAAVDARAAAEEAPRAGGTVQFGPEEIGDTGTMVFVEPPGGGATGIWQ